MSGTTKGIENDYNSAGFWSDKTEAWHDFGPGVKRRILCNNSAATMAFYKFDGGSQVPLHSHPQAQYGICLEGSGVFTVGDKTWKLKKGDSYYIPPSMTHGLKIDPSSSASLIEFFTPLRRDFLKETFAADGP
jgi:quercetin dioxygenase-like cupin family protein